jgi:O-antigen/teichoic acid export membrane protein
LKQLWQSPTLRSSVVHGLAGAGFAGANLILARVLPTEQYALFTLVIALGNIGFSMAPVGLDGVVVRRHLPAGPRLLKVSIGGSAVVGLAFAAIGALAYGLSPVFTGMLFFSCAAGGVMEVASARLQAEQRFSASLALIQSPNIVLLLSALAVVLARATEAWLPILISTIGFIVAAVWGWGVLLREWRRNPDHSLAFTWGEALSFAGLSASGLLLVQLDRLVIPYVLPLSDLALFGVLAAIVGSLYRVLQMGVGFSLLQRLRAAPDLIHRRRLIAHEARLVGSITVVGSVGIYLFAPFVEHLLLAGKYHLGAPLVLAGIVSGIGKIANSFSKAIASALAEPRELSLVNIGGWVSVVVSIGAAVVGARWELTGVVYGVALGWFLRAIFAGVLIVRHLRLPVGVPVTTR